MPPDSPILRRLAVSHFLLECQFWFPVWMLFLDHRGFDLSTMVLADGVFRFTMVGLEFPLGVFSDRVGRRKTYILIAALAAATYAGVVLVDTIPVLFAVWILWGAFWALASGATSAYCYELVAREGKQEQATAVFGFMRAVASAACLISHLAAGFLFAVDPALPFIVNGGLALGALAIAFTLPETHGGMKESAARGSQSLREFLSLHRRDAAVFSGIALLAVLLIYFWSPRILMQPLFLELNLEPSWVSATYFFYSLAGILAGLLVSRWGKALGSTKAVWLGFGLLWTGVFLVGIVPGRAALLFFPLLSFGFFLAHTTMEVFLHGQLEDRHRASVLSAASFVGGAFIIFSRPGLGLLADTKSAPFAFLTWAAIGMAVALLIGILTGRLHRRGAGLRSESHRSIHD